MFMSTHIHYLILPLICYWIKPKYFVLIFLIIKYYFTLTILPSKHCKLLFQNTVKVSKCDIESARNMAMQLIDRRCNPNREWSAE